MTRENIQLNRAIAIAQCPADLLGEIAKVPPTPEFLADAQALIDSTNQVQNKEEQNNA